MRVTRESSANFEGIDLNAIQESGGYWVIIDREGPTEITVNCKAWIITRGCVDGEVLTDKSLHTLIQERDEGL